MSYKYYLYGLNVESEIEIEEAYRREFVGEPDVKVAIGEMPQQVQEMYKDKKISDDYSAISRDGMVFRIPNIADYSILKDRITVKPFEGARASDIKCFLLGSSFGFCMILRRILAIHGGAVSKYGKGIIVTGESGAGKSTVSDALIGNGYIFIADDVCAISSSGNKSHINMAYPQQKLCRDAALAKGYDLSELIYINEERDKFAKRLTDGFLPEGADFDYLFELVLSDNDELTFREIQGHEKLMLILRNVFRGEGGFATWGVPPEYMQICLRVASTVKIYQISRPKNLDTLPEIIGFIEEKVKN